jgi:RNA polymerase subunit RPABC4/transcription elongation factor Spt4
MLSPRFHGVRETLPEGGALDFLKKACALFSGNCEGETISMKCPCCSAELAELWQPLVVITDEKGRALSEPNSVVDVQLGKHSYRVFIKLQWMQCYSVSCGRVLVRAEELFYDPQERRRQDTQNMVCSTKKAGATPN